jgi:hypothetical protein
MKTSLALATLLAACGGDGGSGGGPIAITDLGTQLSDALCKKAFMCCTQPQLTALFQSTTTLTTTAQCETYLSGLISGFAIPQYQASIAAGRATYNGSAAEVCVDLLESATCTEFDADATDTAAPSGCAGLLVAQVGSAGACTQDYECTTGYCQGAAGGSTPTDGHCAAIPSMGQACESTCTIGLYCDFSSLTCQATKADGSTCTMGNECTSGGCIDDMCGLACAAE